MKIAENALRWLKAGGHLLIEHGYDQPLRMQEIFKSLGYDNIKTHADLAKHPRVTSGTFRN